MGQFSFHNNASLKTLEVTVEGVMSVPEAVSFISQYKKNIAAVQADQYELSFDCTKLGVSSKESTEKLDECFKMYKQANFKKIVFKVGNSPILKMQLSRLAKTVDLKNYEFK